MTAIADLSAIKLAAAIRARRSRRSRRSRPRSPGSRSAGSSTPSWRFAPSGRAAEAKAAEAAMMNGAALGALHGVPFSVKDLTNTEGVATTQGSALFAGTLPSSDAVAVARARAAGAILIGKTTTPEFGHKPFTEGPVLRAHAQSLERTPIPAAAPAAARRSRSRPAWVRWRSAPMAAARSASRPPAAASSGSRRRSARSRTCRRPICSAPIPMSARWRATSPIRG
jgi:hypothetical protein